MKSLILILSISLAVGAAIAADGPSLDALLRDSFAYRNLGPFRAGSWIADIAVPETPAKDHLYTFYVAARNGGLWQTTNNGTTFERVFEGENVASMGAVAVAPSDANIVWAGTGDASCTRSAYWGDGIYKSIDRARTWQHLGLTDSHHIARIVIHPGNPDVVYVAAMGHLFSENEERGVFKTTDGGKTWKKILFVNNRTGVIDLVLNKRDPNILYAATYDCIRRPWRLEDGGPGTGIYKTTDGGTTWKKLEGGLPTGTIGRIGLDIYQKNPDILYAVVDNRNPNPSPAEGGGQGRGRGGAAANALVGGEMYRTEDGGQTWTRTSSARDDLSRKSGYAFNQVRVDPGNSNQIFVTGSSMASSSDGGKTWGGLTGGGPSPFRRAFGDFRTLWIDPQNPDRMIAGSDGGVFISYDAGKTCDHLANLPLGEVYALAVDMEKPYNIYAGLQDHESWKGPSDGWSGSVGIEDWSTVGIGDGMYNQVDPTDSRWVYNTQEFGRLGRFDQKTRTRTIVGPTQSADQTFLRWNWVSPTVLSPHDPKTIYVGAQVLFRSRDRGDHWEQISPDLTGNDTNKVSRPPLTIQFCTITTIAESPAKAGIVWAGTDDGKVQLTQNGGTNWTDVTAQVAEAGGPAGAWVTRVCASHFRPGTAYVSKSFHRQDDFRAFVYRTDDFGATWTQITSGLPVSPVHVVFEDTQNSDLLFLGNGNGIYVSLDGGRRWNSLKGNMPIAAVHDLLVHPRDGELVAGTFGRGIWVTDITPLRELNDQIINKEAFLFSIQPRAWRQQGAQGNYRLYGDRLLTTPNGANGLTFEYYLKTSPTNRVTLTVADANGNTIRTIPGTARPGINRIGWNAAAGGRGAGGGGRGAAAQLPAAGDYTVTLQVGDQTYTQKARVLPGPTSVVGESE